MLLPLASAFSARTQTHPRSAAACEERNKKKRGASETLREEAKGRRRGKRKEKEREAGREKRRERERGEKEQEKGARVCPRTSLRLKFESRRFLSRRNESPCTRAGKVPGSRAETPSYYFYGPETSAGIIIISPGRGRARSSVPSGLHLPSSSTSSSSSSQLLPCRCTPLLVRSFTVARSLFGPSPFHYHSLFPLPYLSRR